MEKKKYSFREFWKKYWYILPIGIIILVIILILSVTLQPKDNPKIKSANQAIALVEKYVNENPEVQVLEDKYKRAINEIDKIEDADEKINLIRKIKKTANLIAKLRHEKDVQDAKAELENIKVETKVDSRQKTVDQITLEDLKVLGKKLSKTKAKIIKRDKENGSIKVQIDVTKNKVNLKKELELLGFKTEDDANFEVINKEIPNIVAKLENKYVLPEEVKYDMISISGNKNTDTTFTIIEADNKSGILTIDIFASKGKQEKTKRVTIEGLKNEQDVKDETQISIEVSKLTVTAIDKARWAEKYDKSNYKISGTTLKTEIIHIEPHNLKGEAELTIRVSLGKQIVDRKITIVGFLDAEFAAQRTGICCAIIRPKESSIQKKYEDITLDDVQYNGPSYINLRLEKGIYSHDKSKKYIRVIATQIWDGVVFEYSTDIWTENV